MAVTSVRGQFQNALMGRLGGMQVSGVNLAREAKIEPRIKFPQRARKVVRPGNLNGKRGRLSMSADEAGEPIEFLVVEDEGMVEAAFFWSSESVEPEGEICWLVGVNRDMEWALIAEDCDPAQEEAFAFVCTGQGDGEPECEVCSADACAVCQGDGDCEVPDQDGANEVDEWGEDPTPDWIIGKWVFRGDPDGDDDEDQVTIEFRDDGSLHIDIDIGGGFEGCAEAEIELDGSWSGMLQDGWPYVDIELTQGEAVLEMCMEPSREGEHPIMQDVLETFENGLEGYWLVDETGTKLTCYFDNGEVVEWMKQE
ncbi:MAG: hypothetical protein RMJ84_02265 [Sandaracinaceae bacterium]|nr:hypothetical protein [Sandaracinaceae bacterium]